MLGKHRSISSQRCASVSHSDTSKQAMSGLAQSERRHRYGQKGRGAMSPLREECADNWLAGWLAGKQVAFMVEVMACVPTVQPSQHGMTVHQLHSLNRNRVNDLNHKLRKPPLLCATQLPVTFITVFIISTPNKRTKHINRKYKSGGSESQEFIQHTNLQLRIFERALRHQKTPNTRLMILQVPEDPQHSPHDSPGPRRPATLAS